MADRITPPEPNSQEELSEWGIADTPYQSEQVDVRQLIAQNNQSHKHEWIARGDILECTRGDHPHGMSYDHLHNIFLGTDEHGNPKFRKFDLNTKTD